MITCGNKMTNIKNWFFKALFFAMLGVITIIYPLALAQAQTQAETGNDVKNEENTTQSKDAVMIIRFNQKYVYFENSLKKVIDKVSAVKPDAKYELQSVVPNDRNDDKYLANLRNVVGVFEKSGVTRDRLAISNVASDLSGNQEINIFVH
jgi:thioredoxin-related protein